MHCDEDSPLFDLQDNATVAFFDHLVAFNRIYSNVHRYLCLMVCSAGICLNLLHFYVLTRRTMRAYVMNALLCAMCVCDVTTMASYFIYILRFRIFDNSSEFFGYSYPWLVFLILHVTTSIALHTSSLYLSVVMAYIRWTALDRLDAKWINHRALRHIFLFTALAVSLISVPTVMVHKIVTVKEVLDSNDTKLDGLYTVQLDEETVDGCRLFRANLWITGIMFKVLPCILIFWFTIALIWKLCEMSEKRRLLRGEKFKPSVCSLLGQQPRVRKLSSASIDRTTLMLIVMMTVFLCTEMPQGLIALLSAMYPTHVHTLIYVNVGELLDMLSLINCLVSFVVYCVMSSTYRATVRSIFSRKKKPQLNHTSRLLT
ncbi:unnamed protein product [Caenorhabditis auriculariae]|uniref:G-protein coupled receptors family 1 profile domain-containing protein n=1 Tax=Caenorhabditis auriculariae TaxID=2777116 RepID=A0A8S1GZY3_9PELO|nr:unnamed protein product [Caenorhabditis auriculariae]